MKKFSAALLFLLTLALLAGCAGGGASGGDGGSTQILLSDSEIQIKGGGAKADGGTVVISAVGTYTVSGSLSDGQLIVDTGDEAVDVTLLLNGVDITCLNGPALHIRQAKNARLQLAEGSSNRLCSGTEGAAIDPNASGAALYAEDDLDIDGPGSLEVLGYINNGIACKDDLDINGGSLSVYAVNNGVRGSESVELKGGVLTVEAGNDGVKSTAADKEGKGYITVSGGSLTVTAAGDGIAAETALTVEDGDLAVTATGDPVQVSSKALKAGTVLTVSGGTVTVAAGDDALQSGEANTGKGDVTVSGGELGLSAKGRAINARGQLFVSGGSLIALGGSDKVTVPAAGGQLCIHVGWAGAAGQTAALLTEGGEELLSVSAAYPYHVILLSSPALEAGVSYRFSADGSEISVPASQP